MKRVVDGFQQMAAHAKAAGVTVLMESHGDFTRSGDLGAIADGRGLRRVRSCCGTPTTPSSPARRLPPTPGRASAATCATRTSRTRSRKATERRYVLTGSGEVPVKEQVRVLVQGRLQGLLLLRVGEEVAPRDRGARGRVPALRQDDARVPVRGGIQERASERPVAPSPAGRFRLAPRDSRARAAAAEPEERERERRERHGDLPRGEPEAAHGIPRCHAAAPIAEKRQEGRERDERRPPGAASGSTGAAGAGPERRHRVPPQEHGREQRLRRAHAGAESGAVQGAPRSPGSRPSAPERQEPRPRARHGRRPRTSAARPPARAASARARARCRAPPAPSARARRRRACRPCPWACGIRDRTR